MGPRFEQLDRVTQNYLMQLATMDRGSFPVMLDYLEKHNQGPVFHGARDTVWIGYDAAGNPTWKLIEGGKHMGKEWIDKILTDEPETAPRVAIHGVMERLWGWLQTAPPWQWPEDVLPKAAAALLRLEVAMKAHQDGEWDYMRENLRWALEKMSEMPMPDKPERPAQSMEQFRRDYTLKQDVSVETLDRLLERYRQWVADTVGDMELAHDYVVESISMFGEEVFQEPHP